MINVSQKFKDAAISTSRKTTSNVIFQIVDLTASPDATPTVTGEASISKKTQISDSQVYMSGKYATFENNYWKLDGSFVLPPKASETGYEVGWWSAELSLANNTFTNPQVLTINFTKDHTSVGLTILFDALANEYASDFTITAYDSLDTVISTETVTNNTLSKYVSQTGLTGYRKIVISVTKWCNPYRRVRVSEVGFGIISEYTGTELINVDVLEDIDTTSSQASTNELKFTLDNQSKVFNVLNPSGIYFYLERRQKINAYLGVETVDGIFEYAPMGTYYLTDWKSNEGALTATFTARDMLDILSQDKFTNTTYTNETLYNIAEAVFTAAGVTDYSIDTALQSIVVSGTLTDKTYREVLQYVAIAGMCVFYSDRYGTVRIKQLGSTASGETITMDNMYYSPKIDLDTMVNTIYVKVGSSTYTYVDPVKPANELTISLTVDNPLISNNTIAQNVAIWILAERKKRYLYEINWRMNPAYECGDIVTAEDEFDEDKTIRITKQNFQFSGYLTGKTNGKGG